MALDHLSCSLRPYLPVSCPLFRLKEPTVHAKELYFSYDTVPLVFNTESKPFQEQLQLQ